MPQPRILTIGHSTRSLDEFVGLLTHHRVTVLIDVRTVPASRRMPHFAKSALERSLPQRGIRYVHMPELGGLRKPKLDSINTGWRNVSFRGYADYMETDEFWAGIDRVMNLPSRPAVMCAEAVPWRCHRSLISDAMLVRGWRVLDIMSETSAPPHELTSFARVEGTRITYPASGGERDQGDEAASLFK